MTGFLTQDGNVILRKAREEVASATANYKAIWRKHPTTSAADWGKVRPALDRLHAAEAILKGLTQS